MISSLKCCLLNSWIFILVICRSLEALELNVLRWTFGFALYLLMFSFYTQFILTFDTLNMSFANWLHSNVARWTYVYTFREYQQSLRKIVSNESLTPPITMSSEVLEAPTSLFKGGPVLRRQKPELSVSVVFAELSWSSWLISRVMVEICSFKGSSWP